MRSLARTRAVLGAALALLLLAGAAAAAPAGAAVASDSDKGPIFDFTDAFYRSNGIDPADLVGRRNGADGLSVVDDAPDANHRDVRVTFTLPAYDQSGNSHFFTVLSDLAPNPFTANAAGRAAHKLADASPVYVFPTNEGDPLAVNHNRQADLIDLRHGYFSNNPLGLWIHVFVAYTPRAFNTAAGRAALADLADRNGLALDGTPIIKTVSEIEELTSARLVVQRKRPLTDTGRYFVCPVLEDPRNGAITPDAFLATVRQADGTPLPAEQHFVDDFISLQTTGDWAG